MVDIRPVEQRERDGELPGAEVIDRNVLEWRLDPTSAHRSPDLTAATRVIVVCNEGYASSLAAATLRELGLTRATDLVGGYQAWRTLAATQHWDEVYRTKDAHHVSWYQVAHDTSLALVADTPGSVIDVGAGCSTLVEELLAVGRADVTALDISAEALELTRHRLEHQAGLVDLRDRRHHLVAAAATLRGLARPGCLPLPDRPGRPLRLRRPGHARDQP